MHIQNLQMPSHTSCILIPELEMFCLHLAATDTYELSMDDESLSSFTVPGGCLWFTEEINR